MKSSKPTKRPPSTEDDGAQGKAPAGFVPEYDARKISALYPPGSEEKRWVDRVLARKKGLGF